MKMHLNLSKAFGLGAVVAVLSAGAAFAAVADTNLNIRSGPGTGYPVIGEVTSGENVGITRSNGDWCHVADPGMRGWVLCTDLAQNDVGLGLTLGTDLGRAPPPYAQPEFTGPAQAPQHVAPEHHHG